MKPLISVIIPVFNHADIICDSIETLFKQTYRPLEIILINDGSTDDLSLLEDRIKDRAKYFEINITIYNQKNQGAAAARNKGFSFSQGEYVIFWDADTLAKPEMLQKMQDVLSKNSLASYVYCKYKFGWKKIKSSVFNEKKLVKNNFIDTTSLIRKKDFVGFDESLNRFQDWDMWLTMLEKKMRGIFIPRVLFSKYVGKRVGYSFWLPSFFYALFPNANRVKQYEKSRLIVLKKHGLI